MKLTSVTLSSAFPRDHALDPLRHLAGDLSQSVLPAYIFYWKRGRLWGSDGMNHAPLNPAVLSFFEPLFTAAGVALGRGALHALMSEDIPDRQAVLVDTLALRASFADYDRAVRHVLATNFPAEAPDLPSA